jgi:4-amino-4-deoxy-L-arabinose transferase-like glycosyltransferase
MLKDLGNLWNESDEDRPSIAKFLLLIFMIALFLRIYLVLYPEVIHNDGTTYIRCAKQILSGNWGGEKPPPLYPCLIALISWFTKDFELAGIWVSVIFGSLIVIPVFYLGKEIVNEKVGMLSALLTTVHPTLYISSGSVLTESTYHFLLSTSVLLSWYAFRHGRLRDTLLFCLLTTLTYLTRPEAIGLLLIFTLWVLLVPPPHGSRRWVNRVSLFLVAILGFLLFASPYLIQIRKETGKWGITKKTSVVLGSLSGEEDAPTLETLRKRKGITLSSMIKHPLFVLGKIGGGLLSSIYKFQQVLNPVLFLMVVLGWVVLYKKRGPISLKGNYFLMSYLFLFFGLVFPFFFITRRYTSQMIPLSLPWAALGFLGILEWVEPRLEGERRQRRFGLFFVIFLLVGLFLQGRAIHPREHRLIQKEVGLWMKDHLPRDVKVMSRLPQEAFYAQLPWVRMPVGAYEVILGEARPKGVRYLVVEEDIEKISPGFWETSRREDIIPVREFKKKDQRVTIFELVEPR